MTPRNETQLSRSDLRVFFEAGIKPPEKYGIGLEYERFGLVAGPGGRPQPLPLEGEVSVASILEALARDHGWEPTMLEGRMIELQKGMTRITIEPGGQMELSGAVWRTLGELAGELRSYLGTVGALTGPMGVRWIASGTHPTARVEEIGWLMKRRYVVMKKYLPTHGRHAHQMMKGTCGQQVNLDFSSEQDAMEKFRVSMALTPIVAAMLANSPITAGTRNGYLTQRMAVWLDTDPHRAGQLPFVFDPEASFDDYIDYALSVPMFFLVRGGEYLPMNGMTFGSFMGHGAHGHTGTTEDWLTHLTTLFPDVRLKSYLEIRGTDSTPPDLVMAHSALWMGIFYGGHDALEAAWAPVAKLGWDERMRLRQEICVRGLASRVGRYEARDVAHEILAIAADGLAAWGASDDAKWLDPLRELNLERGMTPAEELIALFGAGTPDGMGRVLDHLARIEPFG